ncbi:MAG: hypothetical protein V3W05_04830 [candidate division NC10 bacterium]
MDNERYLVPVEEIDCLLDPGKVIMGIRHQSNVHNDLDSRAISHLTCGVKDTPDGRLPMSDDRWNFEFGTSSREPQSNDFGFRI